MNAPDDSDPRNCCWDDIFVVGDLLVLSGQSSITTCKSLLLLFAADVAVALTLAGPAPGVGVDVAGIFVEPADTVAGESIAAAAWAGAVPAPVATLLMPILEVEAVKRGCCWCNGGGTPLPPAPLGGNELALIVTDGIVGSIGDIGTTNAAGMDFKLRLRHGLRADRRRSTTDNVLRAFLQLQKPCQHFGLSICSMQNIKFLEVKMILSFLKGCGIPL